MTQGGNKILKNIFIDRLESHYGKDFVPMSDKGNETEMARIKRKLCDSRWILLEQIFNLIDTNSDGHSTFSEFDSSCKGIKLALTKPERDWIVHTCFARYQSIEMLAYQEMFKAFEHS